MDDRYYVIDDAARLAREFVDGLPERHVGATADLDELRDRLTHPLTDAGEDPTPSSPTSRATSTPGSSRPPARATSASSSAARCRSPSRPTG